MNPVPQALSSQTQTADIWQCLLAAQDLSRFAIQPNWVAWQSLDGQTVRVHANQAPSEGRWPWVKLQGVTELPGASHGQVTTHHYVVETDVDVAHEAALNDWYQNEHLPGLAAVPGTVRARRYLRTEGRPKWVACYDLTSPETLERAEWLAVRHTDWSSRVRPMFQNTFRTMYRRITA
jgi:hypothetical protein